MDIARIGNGVTDLRIVGGFYRCLGFEPGAELELGDTLSAQSELLPGPLTIQVVRRDGFDLELVQHGNAGMLDRHPFRRAINQQGLAYLALAVDGVERVAELVADAGGTRYDITRTRSDELDALFCADPCGLRLLLVGVESSAFGPLVVEADGIAVAFVGATVADLDRSLRFYAGMGFTLGRRSPLGRVLSTLVELDDVPVEIASVQRDTYRFVGPRTTSGGE